MVPKDVRETHEVAQTAETDEKKRKKKARERFPTKMCSRNNTKL